MEKQLTDKSLVPVAYQVHMSDGRWGTIFHHPDKPLGDHRPLYAHPPQPTDTQAHLEAYGREKMREGVQRAADIALCHSDDRPRRYSMDWNDGYIDGCKGASDAILAEMEKLK